MELMEIEEEYIRNREEKKNKSEEAKKDNPKIERKMERILQTRNWMKW